MRNINEIKQLEAHITHLKSLERRDGTKIHYAQVRLERLKAGKDDTKRAIKTKPAPKRPPSLLAKPCPENRAFVLAAEMHDLTRALIALERLR